jgi:hypothetical protein
MIRLVDGTYVPAAEVSYVPVPELPDLSFAVHRSPDPNVRVYRVSEVTTGSYIVGSDAHAPLRAALQARECLQNVGYDRVRRIVAEYRVRIARGVAS